ncbi:hypothetical protein PGT21_022945 [Puccinia graminis f. sp. tritici]|uniref:Uncharacterized protein n=2 Tax=Puccinia graminis f. sp. tritici TaxID=56615 RepID=E3KZU0_PUCGT|nr:uncharacterized protein PGTG_15777 [Puccinia graminis f. sp. tritici CRL 75-36-700-3]EFP89821.1 hypothetical protein PGTG_15777 [Puccinia graminis f. sp. tritici CRL 75-36-700-3]KAA1116689.1 hypothetical protein PGT21_022945 [Puccinia graminis f. sp. tritici]
MQFPTSALALITLLVSFPLAMHAQNVPNDYMIKQNSDPKRLLEVYSANGKVAYRFTKTAHVPSQGQSMITVADGSLQKVFSMVTGLDDCSYKTNLAQVEGPTPKDQLPKRQYKFDERKLWQNSVWRFNVYSDSAGARVYYKFKKNRTNKGGQIFKVAANQPSQLVSLLRSQTRKDNWLDPVKGTDTFTLSSVDGAPVTELATLLYLVFTQC